MPRHDSGVQYKPDAPKADRERRWHAHSQKDDFACKVAENMWVRAASSVASLVVLPILGAFFWWAWTQFDALRLDAAVMKAELRQLSQQVQTLDNRAWAGRQPHGGTP